MKICALLIYLVLFSALASRAEEEQLTDNAMLNTCFRNAGKQMARDILQNGIKEISIKKTLSINDKGEDFILLENLTNEMKFGEGSVFFIIDSTGSKNPILSYWITEKSVDAKKKEYFFSEPAVERLAKVKVSFRMVNPETGEILIAKEVVESLHNTISEKAYTTLKKRTVEKGVSFKGFLEPAFVTAIIGGLMYLFYSHKSNQ